MALTGKTWTETAAEIDAADPWLQARRAEGYMVVRGYDRAVSSEASNRDRRAAHLQTMRDLGPTGRARGSSLWHRLWSEAAVNRMHHTDSKRDVGIWTRRLGEQRAFEAQMELQARVVSKTLSVMGLAAE